MKSILVCSLILGSVAACGGDDGTTPAPMSHGFTVRLENVAPWTVAKSGAQTMKTDGKAGPIGPGEAFEVSFTAGKGHAVTFATMLGESNDWFFAPGPAGIALYDAAGMPVEGDVTDQVALWNAGTEIDQEPGVGPDTGPMQATPTQGAPDPDPTVRLIGPSVVLSDGTPYMVPAVPSMVKATLMYQGNQTFLLRVENVSAPMPLHASTGDRVIHASPLVWAVHGVGQMNVVFTPGAADRHQGLEELAEAGNTAPLAATLASLSGAATPISPLLAVVHAMGEPLFSLGQPDTGMGLQALAEAGNPAMLAASNPSGLIVNTPMGAAMPGPALPGQAFEFPITAMPGDRLSFVTMFGTSNDWFFATPPDGMPLFGMDGEPLSGDVTERIALYDAGTEINQEPGVGPDTGPQQMAPDQGQADPVNQVRAVPAAEYAQPASAHLRVTLSPI